MTSNVHEIQARNLIRSAIDADIRKYLERGGEIQKVTDPPRQSQMSPSREQRNVMTWENRK